MTTTITVLYPDVDDATFDTDRHFAAHMPPLAERFAAHGMTGWRVLRFVGTPAGGESPVSVQATLDFGSAEGLEAAVAAEGAAVFGDVPDVSDRDPQVLIGDVMGDG